MILMSPLPSSATCLSAAMRNENPDVESFHKFFECWLVEQNQHLQELISASKQHQNTTCSSNGSSQPQSQDFSDEAVLVPLINRVVEHYEDYYRAKSRWVKQDVLAMLSPSWISSLEEAFLWIGGWRPSMAFHLLYSKSGLQLEAKLQELIRGLGTGDLGDLSSTQLSRVDELQRMTIREEKDITEKMAKLQETVADTSMVQLSHVVTELMSGGETSQNVNVARIEEDMVEPTLDTKEEALRGIFQKADDLRLTTLKAVVDILTPIQAVHFLIAAAELHLRLHDWGKKRDDARLHHGTSTMS